MLEPLAAAVPAGTWIIDDTTTAVRPTAERAARWAARGHRFVHAPVFMAPSNCGEGTGLMLVSGAQADHDTLLAAQLEGVVHRPRGPDPEQARIWPPHRPA